MPRVTSTIAETRGLLASAASEGPRVLVPTMGALHRGHASLLEMGRELAGSDGTLVASIFVNPTQFAPGEDLDAYPRTLEADLEICRKAGVDVVFAPAPEEVYGELASTVVSETALSQGLCGLSRPTHFEGVCTIVLKLLNIVDPDLAVFGKKDYQQLAIIRRMVTDLDVPVEIVGGETVREPDGLALSSRNAYLTASERAQAPALRKGLLRAQELQLEGSPATRELIEAVRQIVGEEAPEGLLDYLEVVDRETLQPFPEADPVPRDQALLAVALFLGKTRLIDNIEL